MVIYEDVPAEDYTGERHAIVSGEHHSRHGNMDQQTRQDSKYRVFVDLHGVLLLRDEAVDGLPARLLSA